MKILGIQRVEFAVHDPAEDAARLEALFDAPFAAGPAETADAFGIQTYTNLDVGLEVLGPAREDSPLTAQLDARGEGLLTVVFRVARIEEAVDWAERKGLTITARLDSEDEAGRPVRQISLAPDGVPAGLAMTFLEDPD